LNRLPTAVHHAIAIAYTDSIRSVFVLAAPIAVIAFIAAWFIPHLELRQAVNDAASTAPKETSSIA
jgi:hypothetical protein